MANGVRGSLPSGDGSILSKRFPAGIFLWTFFCCHQSFRCLRQTSVPNQRLFAMLAKTIVRFIGSFSLLLSSFAYGQQATLTVHLDKSTAKVSPMLYGL